jgi:CheY-like chemotaxis protein
VRILVAEDNPMNQEVACRILAKFGYRADTASDGAEAVEAHEMKQYDIILMDVQMPNLSGFDATKLIREAEKSVSRHVPIIAMTAHAMKGDRERCLRAGMDDYISKPVDPEELRKVIERWTHNIWEKSEQEEDLRAIEPEVLENVISRWTNFVEKRKEVVKGAPNRDTDGPVRTPAPDIDANAPIPAALTSLRELADGDEELVSRLIGMFLSDTEEHQELLRAAIEQGDADKVRQEAHRIKGASAQIEANGLRDIAFRLECMGKDNTLAEALQTMDDFDAEYRRVRAYLEQEVLA